MSEQKPHTQPSSLSLSQRHDVLPLTAVSGHRVKLEDATAEELLVTQDTLEDFSTPTLYSVTLKPHVVTVPLAALAAHVSSDSRRLLLLLLVLRFVVTHFVRFLRTGGRRSVDAPPTRSSAAPGSQPAPSSSGCPCTDPAPSAS